MAFRPSEKSRDARKPNRCVLGCRSCGARVRIRRSSPRLLRRRSPHRGTGRSAVRRAGSKPVRQLPPTRQRGPLCRDPSRLRCAESPDSPRRPHSCHGSAGSTASARNAHLHVPGAHFRRSAGASPRPLYNTRRRPALSTPVRRLGATSAFPPTTTAQAVVKAAAPYHRVTKASLAACLANPLPHKARMPLLPPVTTPLSHAATIRPKPTSGVVTGGIRKSDARVFRGWCLHIEMPYPNFKPMALPFSVAVQAFRPPDPLAKSLIAFLSHRQPRGTARGTAVQSRSATASEVRPALSGDSMRYSPFPQE